MQLIVDYAALRSALQLCGTARGSQQIIPILKNVRLATKGPGALEVASTDLELTVIVNVQAMVRNQGAVTCELAALLDIAKNADAAISLETADNGRLNITTGSAKYALPTQPAEDYPTLPTMENAESIELSASEILPMLRTASYAMSADEKRFNVDGCYFALTKHSIDVVASDGHRMALCELPQKNKGAERGVMIPANLVNAADKLTVTKTATDVLVAWNDNHASLTLGDVSLMARREDGNFIRYREVIPVESFRITVETERLKSALTRAVPFTMASKCVRFGLSKGSMALSTQNTERGQFADAIPIDYSGDGVVVGYSGAYLLDAINTVYTSRMEMAFTDEGPKKERATVIRPIDSDLPFTALHISFNMVL